MPNFESTSSVPGEKKQPELSPEDQAVMSRRRFLAGTVGMYAAAAAPEVMAAPEQEAEALITFTGFSAWGAEARFNSQLKQVLPGAKAAEFTLLRAQGDEPIRSIDVSSKEYVRMRLVIVLDTGKKIELTSRDTWPNNGSGHDVLMNSLVEDLAKKKPKP